MDLVFSGRLSHEVRMKDVLAHILECEIPGSCILRLDADEEDYCGRLLFTDSRYVVAALCQDTRFEGYEAVRQLLSLASGRFAYLRVLPTEQIDLVPSLHISVKKLAELVPKFPDDPRDLFDEKSLLDRVFSSSDALYMVPGGSLMDKSLSPPAPRADQSAKAELMKKLALLKSKENEFTDRPPESKEEPHENLMPPEPATNEWRQMDSPPKVPQPLVDRDQFTDLDVDSIKQKVESIKQKTSKKADESNKQKASKKFEESSTTADVEPVKVKPSTKGEVAPIKVKAPKKIKEETEQAEEEAQPKPAPPPRPPFNWSATRQAIIWLGITFAILTAVVLCWEQIPSFFEKPPKPAPTTVDSTDKPPAKSTPGNAKGHKAAPPKKHPAAPQGKERSGGARAE